MLRMAALIQQIGIGFFAGKNRYQHLGLRVMLAKVIAKTTLPVMNCLHKYLLLSLSIRLILPTTVASRGGGQLTLCLRKTRVNSDQMNPTKR
jgi:hypothetical protein